MSPVRAIVLLALCLCVTPCSAAFRGSSAKHKAGHAVSISEVESSLRASLEEKFSGGRGMEARRLAAIEKSTWPTFQSLPKNEQGRLGPKSVRYIVHSYFAKEHGWLIQGLDPHGHRTNVTEVHEVSILQDKAPALVEALLEHQQSDRGLALGDVVTMIAVLERLIFDESMELLAASYTVNEQSAAGPIDETALHEVLRSYMLIFGSGGKVDSSEVEKHRQLKAALKNSKSYADLKDFAGDTIGNYRFEHRNKMNPFASGQYSFDTVGNIAEVMMHGYGKWQNADCKEMKASLMELDPTGTGRVSLGSFYSQPEGSLYQFTESVDYLRQTGALDETGRGGPAVLIPNYLAGPTNCIASSAYFSVCCMNECEGLMNELEHKIQAPMASPERLLGIVGNLSSSTVDSHRDLPQQMKDKLHSIADQNEGEVPLHGRLFAQWLHFAFPNECPYPQITENTAVLTPAQWLDDAATVSSEEKEMHMESVDTVELDVPFMSQWSDDEVLLVVEPQKPKRSALAGLVRVVVQVAGLVVVLRSAISAWGRATSAYGGGCAAKDKKTDLPW